MLSCSITAQTPILTRRCRFILLKNIDILCVSLLLSVEEAENHRDELDRTDAIIFGSPTCMGSVSGFFKQFMDATSSRWMEGRWQDKLAAGFTNSASQSGDKLNTLVQMAVFAAQHGMDQPRPQAEK